jgi:hypothetical protein
MSCAGTDISPNGGTGISRPTIELPLDELLYVNRDSPEAWGEVLASIDAAQANKEHSLRDQDTQVAPNNLNSLSGHDKDQKPLDIDFATAQVMQAKGARIASTFTHSHAQQQQQQKYPVPHPTSRNSRPTSCANVKHPPLQ